MSGPYQQIFEEAQQGILAFDAQHRIFLANRAMAALLGFEGRDDLIGRSVDDFLLADVGRLTQSMTRRSAEEGGTARDTTLLHRDGTKLAVLLRLSRLADTEDYFATFANLDRWRAALRERDEAVQRAGYGEERYRQIVETAEEGIVTMDLDRTITFANQRLADMLGVSVRELVLGLGFEFEADLRSLFEPADVERFQGERTIHCHGSDLHVLVKRSPLHDSDGNLIGQLAMLTDVTDRKVYEAQLAFQAQHDPLTRLPNRTLFMERLRAAITRAGTTRTSVAVIFLDLDEFKAINSRYGHDGGDALLVCIADRLAASLRPTDTVARFGGDEFLILAEGVGDFAVDLANRLRATIDAPCNVGPAAVRVGACMGIAVATGHADPESLLRDADIAMLHAKELGRGRTELFTPRLRSLSEGRSFVVTELQHALANGELVLRYQPVVRLSDQLVVGVEALIRWDHPARGTLKPDEFIALAEETGLIVPIGRWAFEEACAQLARMAGVAPDLRMSVNVSTNQLATTGFSDTVAAAIAASGVNPRSLAIEVTETALTADVNACVATLTAVRAQGVAVSLDDFGTGYSSLSQLTRLPVDSIKIDQAFVARLATDPRTTAVVRAVLQMADALGLIVVAEGVEDAAQAAALKALGCGFGQGFHYHQPLLAAELDALLAAVPTRAVS